MSCWCGLTGPDWCSSFREPGSSNEHQPLSDTLRASLPHTSNLQLHRAAARNATTPTQRRYDNSRRTTMILGTRRCTALGAAARSVLGSGMTQRVSRGSAGIAGSAGELRALAEVSDERIVVDEGGGWSALFPQFGGSRLRYLMTGVQAWGSTRLE